MCLTVYTEKNKIPEPKIAENDIHCYKILIINDYENLEESFKESFGLENLEVSFVKEFQLKTPYCGFEMEPGEHYKEKEENLVMGRNNYVSGDEDEYDAWDISEGMFHSYASIEDAVHDVLEFHDGNIIFHAIIPKGAKYFTGDFGGFVGYASNEILITKSVAFFDDYFELLDSTAKDDKECMEILYRNELNNRGKIVETYNLPLNENGFIDNEKMMGLSLDELKL
jgi:hypothetical protein